MIFRSTTYSGWAEEADHAEAKRATVKPTPPLPFFFHADLFSGPVAVASFLLAATIGEREGGGKQTRPSTCVGVILIRCISHNCHMSMLSRLLCVLVVGGFVPHLLFFVLFFVSSPFRRQTHRQRVWTNVQERQTPAGEGEGEHLPTLLPQLWDIVLRASGLDAHSLPLRPQRLLPLRRPPPRLSSLHRTGSPSSTHRRRHRSKAQGLFDLAHVPALRRRRVRVASQPLASGGRPSPPHLTDADAPPRPRSVRSRAGCGRDRRLCSAEGPISTLRTKPSCCVGSSFRRCARGRPDA
jgi:hypothetical protein